MDKHGFRSKKLTEPSNLGEKLNSARKQKRISLERAESETRIRVNFIEAMENNNFHLLPTSVYGRGFVRRYAEYLGLDPVEVKNEMISVPKNGETKSQPFSPASINPDLHWVVTPRTIMWIAVIAVFATFVTYIYYQVKAFSAPPTISISAPAAESTTKNSTAEITGTTDPGSSLYINDNLANVGSNGSFDEKIQLQPGINVVSVRVVNRINKQAGKQISILYQAPPTPMPTPIPSPTITPSPTPAPSSSPSPVISPSPKLPPKP